MRLNEFTVTEGSEETPEDVKMNHPEVYQFLEDRLGHMSLEGQSSVSTYDLASAHHVVVAIKPSAGIGNTIVGLENAGTEFEVTESPSYGKVVRGEMPGFTFEITMSGPRGNLTQKWDFAIPHEAGWGFPRP